MTTHYDRLGLDIKALSSDIETAYKKLMNKWAPENNDDKVFAEQMRRKISAAYDCLINPDLRREYDISLQRNKNTSKKYLKSKKDLLINKSKIKGDEKLSHVTHKQKKSVKPISVISKKDYKTVRTTRDREQLSTLPGNFFANHQELSQPLLPILIKWLTAVHEEHHQDTSDQEFKVSLRALHMAMRYIGFYLSKCHNVKTENLQLIASSAYILAVFVIKGYQHTVTRQISPKTLHFHCDKAYTAASINKMIRNIRNCIIMNQHAEKDPRRLHMVTPIECTTALIKKLYLEYSHELPDEFHRLKNSIKIIALTLVNRTLPYIEFYNYYPSKIAAAAVLATFNILNKQLSINEPSEAVLIFCAEWGYRKDVILTQELSQNLATKFIKTSLDDSKVEFPRIQALLSENHYNQFIHEYAQLCVIQKLEDIMHLLSKCIEKKSSLRMSEAAHAILDNIMSNLTATSKESRTLENIDIIVLSIKVIKKLINDHGTDVEKYFCPVHPTLLNKLCFAIQENKSNIGLIIDAIELIMSYSENKPILASYQPLLKSLSECIDSKDACQPHTMRIFNILMKIAPGAAHIKQPLSHLKEAKDYCPELLKYIGEVCRKLMFKEMYYADNPYNQNALLSIHRQLGKAIIEALLQGRADFTAEIIQLLNLSSERLVSHDISKVHNLNNSISVSNYADCSEIPKFVSITFSDTAASFNKDYGNQEMFIFYLLCGTTFYLKSLRQKDAIKVLYVDIEIEQNKYFNALRTQGPHFVLTKTISMINHIEDLVRRQINKSIKAKRCLSFHAKREQRKRAVKSDYNGMTSINRKRIKHKADSKDSKNTNRMFSK